MYVDNAALFFIPVQSNPNSPEWDLSVHGNNTDTDDRHWLISQIFLPVALKCNFENTN